MTKDFKAIVNAKVDKLKGLRVDVPFDFIDPSRAAPPLNIYDPLWLRRPDPNAAAVKLFPPAAIKAGYKSGQAKVDCTVARDGTLHDCVVVEEDPAGLGFGQAALVIASVMQMNPWTQQGSPVEGAKIELPVKLVLPNKADAQTAAPVARR
ncbi:MAG: energy transducer TonB [Caulobacteraceae bacterium]